MPNRRSLKASLLTLAVLAAVVLCFAADRGQPAIKSLQQLGIKTIIDLRTPREVWPREAAKAADAGMSYTNVPFNGLGRPTDEQVDHVLALIETSTAPVFIHCEHGCDRTGTIIACYRIRHDHWPLPDAIHEADAYGLSTLERGMRNYLAAFAASVAKNQ